jgi:peptidoglycan/LPS O-acetylase OafA/YrhL
VINRITHRFWLGMVISAVLAWAAGYLSYRFVEKPFLRKRHKTPDVDVAPSEENEESKAHLIGYV